jgi:hypothetical protein
MQLRTQAFPDTATAQRRYFPTRLAQQAVERVDTRVAAVVHTLPEAAALRTCYPSEEVGSPPNQTTFAVAADQQKMHCRQALAKLV